MLLDWHGAYAIWDSEYKIVSQIISNITWTAVKVLFVFIVEHTIWWRQRDGVLWDYCSWTSKHLWLPSMESRWMTYYIVMRSCSNMLFHSAQRRHHYLGGRCPTTCCMRSDGRKWAQHKSDRNDILKASFNTLVGSMRRRCQARIDGGELLFCVFFLHPCLWMLLSRTYPVERDCDHVNQTLFNLKNKKKIIYSPPLKLFKMAK